jgi:holo-[acyl-carrier protein] synthase
VTSSLESPCRTETIVSFGNVVAVGIDLTLVPDVRDSLATFGTRYLNRVFTPREYADACSSADPAPHLAARFAAKEATIKALKVEGAQPEWTSMEVWRHPMGWCDEMRLTGSAARLAASRGVDRLFVSLSHEGDAAVAVVVATTAT